MIITVCGREIFVKEQAAEYVESMSEVDRAELESIIEYFLRIVGCRYALTCYVGWNSRTGTLHFVPEADWREGSGNIAYLEGAIKERIVDVPWIIAPIVRRRPLPREKEPAVARKTGQLTLESFF